MDDFDFTQSNMDEIKYGLIGTTDEKGNWFDYQLNKVKIKIAFDHEDNDIIHIKLFADFGDQVAQFINIIGTNFELRTKTKKIE